MSATIVRYEQTTILVLCALGHMLAYCDIDTFAGSFFEAELSHRTPGDRFDRMADACQGHGHQHEEPTL